MQKAPPKPKDALDRLPPQNLEAEKGAIGSILYEPAVADDIVGIVQPTDFYSDANRILFERIMEMHNAGKRVDATLLHERLKKTKEIDVVGGLAYLMEVAECTPHAANGVYYSRIVREKSTLRSIIRAATEDLRESFEDTDTAEEILARAESRIFAISERNTEGEQHSIQESLACIFTSGSPKYIAGLETGYMELDAILGGMRPQEFVVLGARPSLGKTALALNISEHLAMNEGKSVLFVSLEMSRTELAARLLCSRGRIDSYRFHADILTQAEKEAATKAHGEMAAKAKIWIDDSPGRRVSDIASAARRMKRKNQLDIIIVDYLQLITPDSRREPRHEQVGFISRRLKGIAKEIDVPVLCLCQLNRQAENEKPKLAHLRESGAIEQDADKVIFIHREIPKKQGEHVDPTIIVAKNRNGRLGEVELIWRPHFTRFESKAAEKHCKEHWSQFNDYQDYGLDGEF